MAKMRIGDLFNLEKGSLQSSKCTPGEYDFITAAEEWKTHNEYSHEEEALIFAAMASGSLGRTHYVNGKFITSDLCYILTPKNSEEYPINLKFYHFVFNSLRDEIVKNTKSGTSKESINQTNLKNYEIPYFDIALQNVWIDRLIKTKEIKEDLADEIKTQQTLLKKLRQAILQEAIEGKLTKEWREENPDVESASVLLEKIKAEKERLVKEKKIKKQKPLPPTSEEEVPFEIPESWVWCRLGDIGEAKIGLTYKPSDISDNGIIVLRSSNIKNGKIDLKDLVKVKVDINDNKLTEVGDILICARNGSKHLVGKSALIKEKGMSFGAFMSIFRSDFYHYIYKFLQSNIFRTQFDDEKSTGINQLTQGILKSIIIPFPPLKEQKEIVKKIENLFAVCDELEAQIESSKANSEMLMQAVLKEAFEG